jgi:hypothetical protein
LFSTSCASQAALKDAAPRQGSQEALKDAPEALKDAAPALGARLSAAVVEAGVLCAAECVVATAFDVSKAFVQGAAIAGSGGSVGQGGSDSDTEAVSQAGECGTGGGCESWCSGGLGRSVACPAGAPSERCPWDEVGCVDSAQKPNAAVPAACQSLAGATARGRGGADAAAVAGVAFSPEALAAGRRWRNKWRQSRKVRCAGVIIRRRIKEFSDIDVFTVSDAVVTCAVLANSAGARGSAAE